MRANKRWYSVRVVACIVIALVFLIPQNVSAGGTDGPRPTEASDDSLVEIEDDLEASYDVRPYAPMPKKLDVTTAELDSVSEVADGQMDVIDGATLNVTESGDGIEVRTTGEWLLMPGEWLSQRVPDFTVVSSSFKKAQVNGRDWVAAKVDAGMVRIASFSPDEKGQFGRGSVDSVWLGERPMGIEVLERPHVEQAVQKVYDNGTWKDVVVERDVKDLRVSFTDAMNTSGQPVWISKSWLWSMGLKRVVGFSEDGNPIPRLETSKHLIFRPTHFSQVWFFDEDFTTASNWVSAESGGNPGFQDYASEGVNTYRSHSASKSAFVQFDGGCCDNDWGTAWLYKDFTMPDPGARLSQVSVWWEAVNYSHQNTGYDHMKAGLYVDLLTSESQVVDGFSYVLVCWDLSTNSCTASGKQKIVSMDPTSTLNQWGKFTGMPVSDWSLTWTNVAKVRVKLLVSVPGGSVNDHLHMRWDDLALGFNTSALTYVYNSALYQGKMSERFKVDIPSATRFVDAELYMPAGADFDLSVWNPAGKRTGGLTPANSTSDTSIGNSSYGGTSSSPEWVKAGTPFTTGYWEVAAYAVSGEGLFTMKFRVFLSNMISSTGTKESPKSKFYVSGGQYMVNASLRMPNGADFDLSLYSDSSTRTGGRNNTSPSNPVNNTPNARYSGTSANPEWVSVAGLPTIGDWFVQAYAASGSGGYEIVTNLWPDADQDGLSDQYEWNTTYKLSFGPQELPNIGIPRTPSYANQSYEMQGFGHFMSASATVSIKRNNSSASIPLDAKVGYWINRTDYWNYSYNTSGWTVQYGTWARFNESGEWMYRQSDASGVSQNAYAYVMQAGKGTYEWKCKFNAGTTPSCGIYVFSDDPTYTNRKNAYYIMQWNNKMEFAKVVNDAVTVLVVNNSATASNGTTHTYKAVVDTVAGSAKVYRDGSTYAALSWTTASDFPTKEGKYISLKTSSANVSFDNVTATVEGWRERALPIPDSGGINGSITVNKNLITLGFEKERFMEKNVWRIRIGKNASSPNSYQTVKLAVFRGDLNLTSDIFNPDSDFDGALDGAEQKSEYVWGNTWTHTFALPVTARYRLNSTVTTPNCAPPCTQTYPYVQIWLDYSSATRLLVWGGNANALAFNTPTVTLQVQRGVHSLTALAWGLSASSAFHSVRKETVEVKNPSEKCRECAVDTRASPVTQDSEYDQVLDGVEGYVHEYVDNREPWDQMAPPTKPAARYYHAMAYDVESDRTVLFGGTGNKQDTWTYDIETDKWVDMNPPSPPSYRYGHAMAYSIRGDRVVMFGGVGNVYYQDTWAYDLNTNTWTDKNPASKPSTRYKAALAYDAASDRFVLFGGLTASGTRLNETWEYDLNSNTWTNKTPTVGPSRREGFGMAYDQRNDRVILFGGTDGTFKQDTWAYDLESNSWVDKNPTGTPLQLWATRLAYDARSDRTLLYGGLRTSYSVTDKTWDYDYESNAWTERTMGTKATMRDAHSMAYDLQSDRIVLFGGTGSSDFDDTWTYHQNGADSVYSLNYSKLVSLAAGLYNVSFRLKAGASQPRINITLDNSTLDERNVTANTEVVSTLRASIGGGDHWLQVRGKNLTDLHYVRFEKIWTDPEKNDTEGDGLRDDEPYRYGTLPTSSDTDLDNLGDATEVNGWDITMNGATTHVDSSPVLSDTDSDGITDWNEYGKTVNNTFGTSEAAARWTAYSGAWSWQKDGGNGVFQQGTQSATLTNAYMKLEQGGTTTYEWRIKFVSGTAGASLVIFASDGASAARGVNYRVEQQYNQIAIRDCLADGSCSTGVISSAGASAGSTYKYKATYYAWNGTIMVWRNGTYQGKWTDTTSPLKTGSWVSLRTDSCKAWFDDVYVNVTQSNPRSNDTDSDGLYDWNDLSGWNPVNGTWEWRDGVYQQTSASGVGNSNSYAAVAQSGATEYEWRTKFKTTPGAAGMHIFASDGAQGERMDSYLVWQASGSVVIYESIENTLNYRAGTGSLPVVADTWYKYKTKYWPANGTIQVFRNGSSVLGWQDSSPLTSGAAISLRTNGAWAQFDDLYVNASGANVARWNGYSRWSERPAGTMSGDNDTDNEGLTDGTEIAGWPITVLPYGTGTKVQRNVSASPLAQNSDSDGWNDTVERNRGTDPRNPNTDGDSSNDDQDQTPFGTADEDGDGLDDDVERNGWWVCYWSAAHQHPCSVVGSDTGPTGPKDTDQDGLTDFDEWILKSNARSNDTDHDGWLDGFTNPIVRLVVNKLTAVDDGDWLNMGEDYLTFTYPAGGLYWRAPMDPNNEDVWLLDSTHLLGSDSAAIGFGFYLATRGNWTRNMKVTSVDRDVYWEDNLGSKGFQLQYGLWSSWNQELVLDEGPCTWYCTGNKVELSQTVQAFADPSIISAIEDSDFDGLNDANESAFKTLPGLSRPRGFTPEYGTLDSVVEVDHMAKGPSLYGPFPLPDFSKLLIGTSFMSQGIHLLIDDGWLGGGNEVPFAQETSFSDFNGNQACGNPADSSLYGTYFTDSRSRVARYALLAKSGPWAEAGRAYAGSDNLILYAETIRNMPMLDSYDKRIAAGFLHELGHTYGLLHTQAWTVMNEWGGGVAPLHYSDTEWKRVKESFGTYCMDP